MSSFHPSVILDYSPALWTELRVNSYPTEEARPLWLIQGYLSAKAKFGLDLQVPHYYSLYYTTLKSIDECVYQMESMKFVELPKVKCFTTVICRKLSEDVVKMCSLCGGCANLSIQLVKYHGIFLFLFNNSCVDRQPLLPVFYHHLQSYTVIQYIVHEYIGSYKCQTKHKI